MGTKFVGTLFKGPVDFRGATLSKVDFSQIKIDKESLSHWVRSEGAFSAHLNFSGAVLYDTSFEGVDLSEADFSGADLTHARLGNNGKMDGIRYDAATKWPPGFHVPPSTTSPLEPTHGDFRCTRPS